MLVRPGVEDDALRKAVDEGHRWWILAEDIPDEDAVMISEYRNSDQNTNEVVLTNLSS